METSELKKQLIEMIEAIDDEELLYLVKEDVVFHATSKAMRSNDIVCANEDTHTFNKTAKQKLRVAGKDTKDKSYY